MWFGRMIEENSGCRRLWNKYQKETKQKSYLQTAFLEIWGKNEIAVTNLDEEEKDLLMIRREGKAIKRGDRIQNK